MSGSYPPSGGNPPRKKPAPAARPETKPGEQRAGEKAPAGQGSGRVTFDDRGNAVWEWSMSTGVFGREVDTRRLKKLEASDLRIADDPAPPQRKDEGPAGPAGGSDPYNSAGPATPPPRAPQRVASTRPTDLRRLSEWIKQQKALGRKVDKE